MASTVLKNYGDMISIVENKAKIAGDVQIEDRDFIKGALNEYYEKISTERSWHWKKFDRSFIFPKAITTGTASVVNGSREAIMTGLTVSDQHVGRTIRFLNQRELYRIIGREVATNKFFLDANYVGTTNAVATYKLHQYEFPLPPDLDTLEMVYVDTGGIGYYDLPAGELDYVNVIEFNRVLSCSSSFSGPPCMYTRDGDVHFETFPPLDVMVLDYDFLAGEVFEKVSKLRIFPIEPDTDRVVHINYSRFVEPMVDDKDIPLIPPTDRWVLVHFALAEWYKTNGSGTMADREFKIGEQKLAEMRQEFIKTDVKPKMVLDGRRYKRYHDFYDKRMIFRMSRFSEYQ